jgi:formate hydrogenlyase subunit 6/NADH:ubiquinone oxidoreductase subunit I
MSGGIGEKIMTAQSLSIGEKVIVERQALQLLLDQLRGRGYEVVGPTVRERAIVYDRLREASDLPVGWTDEQDGGTYRLKRRGDEALFGYVVGPHSWKRFLHPPVMRLWRAERSEDGFQITDGPPEAPKYAFIGVRACELHAIQIQDKVFMGGAYIDSTYKARREQAFIVAVNCGQAGGTCFCVSMKSGPQVTAGFDLALTEILTADRHDFVVEVGTQLGAEVLEQVPHRAATSAEIEKAAQIVAQSATQMGRTLDTTGIKGLLYGNSEHPRWDEVASRCLACANCTMVCPTCFCATVEDVTDLTGREAERWRKSDSCFTTNFSYIHGGSLRTSAKARYRQWMTHKLASWIDQFGTSGCVGCGRCITWCPVGIDITQEVRAIQESEANKTFPLKEVNHA